MQELPDGVPAAGAEADQNVPHHPSDSGVPLVGEHLGQRHHDAGAERVAQLFHLGRRGLVAGAQPCQGMTHRRPGDHPVDGLACEAAHRVRLHGRVVVRALPGDGVEEFLGSLEVARQGQVFDVTADRAGDIAPAKWVGFHVVQEVEQQLQVERLERRATDRLQPRGDPLLRVVADIFDLGRLCAREVQLAGVLRRHELLVAIRRQQRLGLFPDVREGVGLSERRLGQLLSHGGHHLTPIVEVGYEGLERLGEPM